MVVYPIMPQGPKVEYSSYPYRYEKAMVRFYIRFDYKTYEHLFFTPYLLVQVLNMGGVLTLLMVLFGMPARLSNMMVNDSSSVVASLESYIAAVAWGDTSTAQVFARQLRYHGLPPPKPDCRWCLPAQERWWRVFERKKRNFWEVNHFRAIMLELARSKQFEHLAPQWPPPEGEAISSQASSLLEQRVLAMEAELRQLRRGVGMKDPTPRQVGVGPCADPGC